MNFYVKLSSAIHYLAWLDSITTLCVNRLMNIYDNWASSIGYIELAVVL